MAKFTYEKPDLVSFEQSNLVVHGLSCDRGGAAESPSCEPMVPVEGYEIEP